MAISPVRSGVAARKASIRAQGRRFRAVNYLGFFIEEMQGPDVKGHICPIGGLFAKGSGYGPGPSGAFPHESRLSRYAGAPRAGGGGGDGGPAGRSPPGIIKVVYGDGAVDGFNHHAQRRVQAPNGRSCCAPAAGPIGILEGKEQHRRLHAGHRASSTSGADASSGMVCHRAAAGHRRLAWLSSRSPGAPRPDLILHEKRAGANEFFPWHTGGATAASRSMEEAFRGAVRRTAARREAATASAKAPCVTQVFLGAEAEPGRRRLRSTAPWSWRASRSAGRSSGPQAVPGRGRSVLGGRPRFPSSTQSRTASPGQGLPQGARVASQDRRRHHPGVEQFESSECPGRGAIEELLRILDSHLRLRDRRRGDTINSCGIAALYAADTVYLVTNPDVPSIRNAQRLVERVRQLGAGSERVEFLLNRVSENLFITPQQSKRPSATRFTTLSRATTGRCPLR